MELTCLWFLLGKIAKKLRSKCIINKVSFKYSGENQRWIMTVMESVIFLFRYVSGGQRGVSELVEYLGEEQKEQQVQSLR